MDSFLRPFGNTNINPFMDRQIDEHTKADVLAIMGLCKDWICEGDIRKALNLGVRRTRTALRAAQQRKLIESRTRRSHYSANGREEYRVL